MREREVIERLRRIATAPEARGLLDDVAVLDGRVITHDSIAEGVHFLPFDPPASVGWKLVAVNLSDLAAKGAEPRAALLSLTISGDGECLANSRDSAAQGVNYPTDWRVVRRFRASALTSRAESRVQQEDLWAIGLWRFSLE